MPFSDKLLLIFHVPIKIRLLTKRIVWWMSFTVDGKPYCRSTETSNKRLAEAIFGKVKTQL